MKFYHRKNKSSFYDFEIFLGGNQNEDFKWSFFKFAEGYFYIANNFAKTILSGKERIIDYLCYPIFFNYRHFFEISLKGCIYVSEIISEKQRFMNGEEDVKGEQKNSAKMMHCLEPLAQDAIKKLENVFGASSIDFCKNFIIKVAKEIDQIDRHSMLFRYPMDKNGVKQIGEKSSYFNLVEIQKTFEEAFEIFETISFGLSATDYRVDERIREIWYNNRFNVCEM